MRIATAQIRFRHRPHRAASCQLAQGPTAPPHPADMSVAAALFACFRSTPLGELLSVKKRLVLSEEQLNAAVERATPDDAWFTPEGGWPATVDRAVLPKQLLPTKDESPSLFLLPVPIGELMVEVLECDRLRRSDFLSENDVFVV